MSQNIQSLQNTGGNKQPQNFPAMLKASMDEIAKALPQHINANRMSRIALTSFRRNPNLAKCDPRSVIAAVIQASQLGLEIDTLGRAYLVPYKGECQFIPGWKGLVELVNRSGQGTVWTGAVFEGDDFDYMLGDSPFVHHRPAGENDPTKMTHAYAIGRPKGAEWPIIEVWTNERIIKHRNKYNKVGSSHYSFGNMEMYARKVPLMQVLKYMPMTPEMATVVELDNAGGNSPQGLNAKDAIDGTWTPIIEEEPVSDSTGEIFDAEKHVAFDKFNQDGSFTKRPVRNKQGAASKEEKPADKNTGSDGDPLSGFVEGMQKATNMDELQEARESANGPAANLNEEQLGALDGIYRTIETRLNGGGAEGNDSFGGME